MGKHRTAGHLLVCLLTALGVFAARPAFATRLYLQPSSLTHRPRLQDLGQLRVTAAVSDANKPISVTSDRVLNWTEGSTEVIHFIGHVSIEQGLFRARMNEAVFWLRKGEAEQGRPLPVEVYGEGDVLVEKPQGTKENGQRAYIELQTLEEFRLRNQARAQQSGSKDPFYGRAEAFRQGIRADNTAPSIATDANGASSGVQPAIYKTDNSDTGKKLRLVQEVLPRARTEPPALAAPGATVPGGPRFQSLPLILPRGASNFQVKSFQSSADEYTTILTGGVMIFFGQEDGLGVVDIGADRIVMWSRNVDPQKLLASPADATPRESNEPRREQFEFYMEGHVEIRQAATQGPEAGITRLLLSDQAYYDVQRNVALLINGEVITQPHSAPAPIYFQAQEIRQVARDRFEANNAHLFSSRLPSDPDLIIDMESASLEERRVPARGLFGRPLTDPTGQPIMLNQLWAEGHDVTFRFLQVPIAYLPSVDGDLRDPLGPINNVRIRNDSVFGTGLLLDWDMYSLLGANTRPPGTRWKLETDYLSQRGPGLGTYFETRGVDLFDLPGIYETQARGYVIYDTGKDKLGGPRTYEPPRDLRDRVLLRHRQEIGEDLTFMGQFAWLSDRNFLEQYYKYEFDNDINQETFIYVKDQHDNYALSALVEPRLRPWVTETQWLPRLDGYLLGESLFDRLTYFARANVGYASQRVTTDIDNSYFATPVPFQFNRVHPLPPSSDFPHYPGIDTARADLWQELDLPFEAGPFKIVPYGLLDLTYYSRTLDDSNVGRVYGGGGVRASIPFTRIYPEVQSTLFNIDGIAHKIVLWADYRWVASTEDFRKLPELDRLNDDATDQAQRDLRSYEIPLPNSTIPVPSPAGFPNATLLATSPLYDPQLYALRRGLEYNVDTLDSMQTVRLGIDQRWQTKRGFPGNEHILDWMTLNTSLTIFPEADRDNFGHSLGLMEYNYIWHIGDRTTFVSNGWLEPYTDGPRVFDAGVYLDRLERTHFYVGYRSIEPVGVDAVILSSTYEFSPKWRGTFTTVYDFGASGNLGNSLILSRIGSDVQVNIGFTYSPLQKNFGFTFEILPTLAASHTGIGAGSAGHGVGR